MGNSVLKTPCRNFVNQKVTADKECWLITHKEDQSQTVTAIINYISHGNSFTGLISAEDLITGERFMIPVHSISLIEKVRLISVEFRCRPKEKDGKKTNGYICHYTIPFKNTYDFSDVTGQNPLSWNNIS